MPVPASECYVLIAGGGPVGLAAAIELDWRGVPAILVTPNLETTRHPKCNSTNARSMEHFRRLGIAQRLRTEGLPPTVLRASRYVTRFCGYELGLLPRPHAEWPTPEAPAIISQMALERALRTRAEEGRHASIHFGWQLNSFEDTGDGVVAEIADVQTGERRTVRSHYLLGADGASSVVRKQLGFRLLGEDGTEPRAFMGGTMLSYFIRAPGLHEASGFAPTHMTWILNPDMRGMMFLQDGAERWIVHYQVPAGIRWQDVDMRLVISRMIGATVEFEILSGGPWTGGLALVSEAYQSGRVFLAGDAAHLFTPLGGIGMNTGIGDVMNLGWKLAARHAGWAGDGLLDTYYVERRPIGIRNSRLGVHCARIMDGWELPPGIEEGGSAADEVRAAFGARIVEEDRVQYQTVGLQLGERYASPIVVDGKADAPDRWDVYDASTDPGVRLPHFWIEPGRSVFDLLGPGFTLLVRGAAGEAAALVEAARMRGVPMKTVSLESAPACYGHAFVLVRPDQHIAWSGDSVPRAIEIIDRVRGAVD